MRKLKRLVCSEDAAELVEFGIASMVFFTLLFGIVEFCLVIYAGNFVESAAQHGARYAMVRGSDWTSACASADSYSCQATAANVQSYVLSLPHPALNLPADSITPTWLATTASGASTACTTNPYAQGCQVQVKVSYTFGLMIPFLPAKYSSIPLSSTSVETIQD